MHRRLREESERYGLEDCSSGLAELGLLRRVLVLPQGRAGRDQGVQVSSGDQGQWCVAILERQRPNWQVLAGTLRFCSGQERILDRFEGHDHMSPGLQGTFPAQNSGLLAPQISVF